MQDDEVDYLYRYGPKLAARVERSRVITAKRWELLLTDVRRDEPGPGGRVFVFARH